MEALQEQKNPLETEPVSKLIIRYSIPTALTLMVNYIYNIADQIFVGQGVGITGMAATNIAFPMIILVNAIALWLGDGCAANISLCLGRKEQRLADETLSHTLTFLLGGGVLVAAVFMIFAPWIVRLFGSTETAYTGALIYMRILALGIPFEMICPAFTAIIRADGNPKYAMKCMLTGAIINLILDPVFIFLLKMGVAGAAVATVIGQTAAGVMFLAYLKKLQTVSVRKDALCPKRELSFRIMALGFPSLLTQILNALMQITMNNLMTRYGEATIYGSDIALSVYGMAMKVYQIAHSMFVGVSSATQPINGFNFGAKHYERVRQTYRLAALIALAISVGWFVIYQGFSEQIGMLFVSKDALYIDCTKHFFRIYMMAFFVYGLHMTTASFFQGIGKPLKALMLPFFRQGMLLIPLSVLLAGRFGLDGALIAAPISDVLTFVLAVVMARMELQGWKKKGWIKKEDEG